MRYFSDARFCTDCSTEQISEFTMRASTIVAIAFVVVGGDAAVRVRRRRTGRSGAGRRARAWRQPGDYR